MEILAPIPNNLFGKTAEKAFSEVRLPFRNSKYSNRIYSNFVHIFCLLYKERLQASYRRFAQLANDMNLQRILCIKRIPHFTTLQKFMQRIDKALLRKLVRACHRIFKMINLECSIDSTGFSLTNPSQHYMRIAGVKARNFVKTSMNIDNLKKIILDIETHTNNSHDTNDFIDLLRHLRGVKIVLADKAYDSTKNFLYVTKSLNAECHIPLRDFPQFRKGYGHKVHLVGARKKRAALFNEQKYHKRSIIESVNSALKRTLGGSVCSRRADNQQKQVMMRALVYNLERMSKGALAWLRVFIGGFLQSPDFRKSF
jgi:transposase